MVVRLRWPIRNNSPFATANPVGEIPFEACQRTLTAEFPTLHVKRREHPAVVLAPWSISGVPVIYRKCLGEVNTMNSLVFRRLSLTCATVCLLLLPGCKPGVSIKTVPVSGTVKLEGAPLAGATVSFVGPDENTKTATGVTDAEGRYRLSCFVTGTTPVDGAMPGQYTVIVAKRQSAQGDQAAARQQAAQMTPEQMATMGANMTPEEAQKRGGPAMRQQMAMGAGGKNELMQGKSEIPDHYSDVKNSGLNATVKESGAQTFDFELKKG